MYHQFIIIGSDNDPNNSHNIAVLKVKQFIRLGQSQRQGQFHKYSSELIQRTIHKVRSGLIMLTIHKQNTEVR